MKTRTTKRQRKYRVATTRVLHMMRRPFDDMEDFDIPMFGGDVETVQAPAQGTNR